VIFAIVLLLFSIAGFSLERHALQCRAAFVYAPLRPRSSAQKKAAASGTVFACHSRHDSRARLLSPDSCDAMHAQNLIVISIRLGWRCDWLWRESRGDSLSNGRRFHALDSAAKHPISVILHGALRSPCFQRRKKEMKVFSFDPLAIALLVTSRFRFRAAGTAKHAITFDDMMKLHRIASASFSRREMGWRTRYPLRTWTDRG